MLKNFLKVSLVSAALLSAFTAPAAAAAVDDPATYVYCEIAGQAQLMEMTNSGTVSAVNAIAANENMDASGRLTAVQAVLDAAYRRGQLVVTAVPDGSWVIGIEIGPNELTRFAYCASCGSNVFVGNGPIFIGGGRL